MLFLFFTVVMVLLFMKACGCQVVDFNMLVGESLCMYLFVVYDYVGASVAVLLL